MIFKNAAARAKFNEAKMGKADLVRGAHLFAGLNSFEPGQAHEPHAHCDRDKLYVILQGTGELKIGDEASIVESGDVALAPADVVHSLENPGPGRLVAMIVMAPPPSRK